MDSEDIQKLMADIEVLAGSTALMDNEVQKFVVLLKQAPNEEALKFIFEACGDALPDFVAKAGEYGGAGVIFKRFNAALERFHREIGPLFSGAQAPQEPPPGYGAEGPAMVTDASMSALADHGDPE